MADGSARNALQLVSEPLLRRWLSANFALQEVSTYVLPFAFLLTGALV